MKVKSITINKEQDNWIDKKAINLSKFVRHKIKEEMEKEKSRKVDK